MKKLLVVFVALVVLIPLSRYSKPQEKAAPIAKAAPVEKPAPVKEEVFINYETLRQWTIGRNGIGMEILVDPKSTKAEVLALAGYLRKLYSSRLANNGMINISIFDTREAWANRMNDNYPEAKYWKHYLAQVWVPPSSGNQEIEWVAKGRAY